MVKHVVEVIQYVEVELDETKFDEEFMQEFRESFMSYHSLEQHATHIGQLVARGIVDSWGDGVIEDFIEGYGPAPEMGIKARIIDTSVEIYRD